MASKKIKGITIEIGGDTTNLGKAIDKTEQKTRSLKGELAHVERLLKFDPTNTELLAQKQQILTESISATSEQLEILKEAEAQVVAQFERGEIGSDQLRAFQREVMKAEKNLNDMRQELQATERGLDEVGDNRGLTDQANQAEDASEKIQAMNETISNSAKVVSAGVVALGGAIATSSGYAIKVATDFDHALNTLATRTGATKEEMDGLEDSMERIYKNNFGESIEDVAIAMSTVKNNTKLAGAELEEVTEYALLLSDTFEFDVNESTRTAKMLMDQFGVSGKDAYNLIAQGAQNGLDKNGDLLDTINEYSVHFKQLGFDAEDMFNMLVNGAESGTFSVDKLGDAVKEFGIRVKDGTADEAFKELGLSVDEVTMKFGNGGKEAQDAMNQVTTALFKMKDPIKQNTAGVQLFGTMWEDLGVDGVKALMKVNGSISKTKTALDDINKQKYDDIGSALKGLGRTIETDVAKPIGEDLQPIVEDAIEYVQDNAPAIRRTITGIAEGVGDFVGWIIDNKDPLLATIAGVGAGLLTWNAYSMISTVVSGIKAFKVATESATIAQAAFNTAIKANPIGLAASLIAGATVAVIGFGAALANEQTEHEKNMEAIQKEADARKETIKAQKEAIQSGVGEMNYLQNLNNELKNLVDQNGNVKKGYENRAKFIVNELNSALGLELELINGQIKGYAEVGKSIDNMIAKKKAEIILEAQLPAYKEAVTKSIDAQTKANKLAAEISANNTEAMRLEAEMVKQYGENWKTSYEALSSANGQAWAELQQDTINKEEEYKKQNNLVKGYYNDIASYETNAARLASGTAEDLRKIEQSVVTAKATSKDEKIKLMGEELQAQQSHLKWMESEYKKGNDDITKEMIEGQKNKIKITKDELEGMNSTVKAEQPKIATAWSQLKDMAVAAAKDPNAFKKAGSKNADDLKKGISSKQGEVKNESKKLADGSVSVIRNKRNEFESAGGYVASGIQQGVENKSSSLWGTMSNLANSMLSTFKSNLQIKSPSRAFAALSRYIPEGIAMGIEQEADAPLNALNAINEEMLASTREINGLSLERQIQATFSNEPPTPQGGTVADLVQLVGDYFPKLIEASKHAIVLDSGVLVGETVNQTDEQLALLYDLKARGV